MPPARPITGLARLAGRPGLDLLPAGAKQWEADTGNTVNTSFHSGDVARTRRPCAPRSPPRPTASSAAAPTRSLVEVVKEAKAAGIPIININTPDPSAGFDAYVGGDLVAVGKRWAQYLVDKGLVKSGDFVWMPVEVPGATYGVQEEEGISSVLKPWASPGR